LGIPLSGGRSGSRNPSSRRANHSENFIISMLVCSWSGCENKRKHRVTISTDRGLWNQFSPISVRHREMIILLQGFGAAWPLYKTRT
jgi:hypothetical protein